MVKMTPTPVPGRRCSLDTYGQDVECAYRTGPARMSPLMEARGGTGRAVTAMSPALRPFHYGCAKLGFHETCPEITVPTALRGRIL